MTKQLRTGAFWCLSEASSHEDRQTVLRCAIKYDSLREEMSRLREQSERLAAELVESFGGAMEKLSFAKEEAREIEKVLQEIRLRIVRTLI